jgi:hypothetical protein
MKPIKNTKKGRQPHCHNIAYVDVSTELEEEGTANNKSI